MHHGYMHRGYMHHGYQQHGYMHHGYMHHRLMYHRFMHHRIMHRRRTGGKEVLVNFVWVTRPERPKGAVDEVMRPEGFQLEVGARAFF